MRFSLTFGEEQGLEVVPQGDGYDGEAGGEGEDGEEAEEVVDAHHVPGLPGLRPEVQGVQILQVLERKYARERQQEVEAQDREIVQGDQGRRVLLPRNGGHFKRENTNF